ncbi:hypothetical protein FIV42_02080 [Persicimonas caeni]|jgi:RecJ-like exonuclease|uniref:Uncharacterized protein n=1 Tax=Persicimonas caeni TaxID=2292766 RepID=A0A4Y6PMN5_PERCE|nr:hypothetical protein [Persicimonas caeni]QDG49568.1 hypothetical protein FIV42_02080 [Persicimonas caeni]QED30789.1 hypothetical protein FRD00_02075 [Persicimonas caeni]
MMKISLSDYIRDVLKDEEPVYFVDPDGEVDTETDTCPGCAGKGRYVGFRWVEDPCEVCGGSGSVHTCRADPE